MRISAFIIIYIFFQSSLPREYWILFSVLPLLYFLNSMERGGGGGREGEEGMCQRRDVCLQCAACWQRQTETDRETDRKKEEKERERERERERESLFGKSKMIRVAGSAIRWLSWLKVVKRPRSSRRALSLSLSLFLPGFLVSVPSRFPLGSLVSLPRFLIRFSLFWTSLAACVCVRVGACALHQCYRWMGWSFLTEPDVTFQLVPPAPWIQRAHSGWRDDNEAFR